MLKRKMIRDIYDYKVQFISIFLMAFIGVAVFTGMYVDTNSFETSLNDYYEETNMADGWIYSNYLIDAYLEQVDLLGATTQMERQLVVDSKAKLDDRPDVKLHFVENNTLSKFYLLEGKPLNINDSEGVWLDKSFADARNLSIGDEITFESNGTEIKKVIRGLGYSPEYVYNSPAGSTVPDHAATGFAYMSHKAFPSDNMMYNVLNVKFDGSPDTYSKLLAYRLDGYYTLFLERSHHYSAEVVSESISQQNSLTSFFPLIFILISMMMLLTTMKRIISHQRTQLGILKANGFREKTITLHFLTYGLILMILGSILGAILGPIIFHTFAHPPRIFYFKFPYWHSSGSMNTIILIPLMGLASVLVSYISIKSIINEPASQIIKPKVPKVSSASFVEKLKIWEKLSFNIRWNFRNINRNKSRGIMTTLGIIGCTILLITGFVLYEKMDESREWYFNDVNHFESKLVIDGNADLSQTYSLADQVNGEPIMESTVEIIKNKTVIASLLVLNDSDLITMTNDAHEKIDIGNDEVSISKKMANIMGIKVGDTIECRIVGSGEKIKVKIDKIHSSPFSQGLVMSPNKLEKLGLKYTPTAIVSPEHINKSYEGTSTIYLSDLINGWNKMEEATMIIICALVFFAVILVLVILYNLNILSFTEMKHDIATLKVLGFDTANLTKILFEQSLFFIIIGFILGIPISYYVLTKVMPAFGNNFYLVPSISIKSLVLSFLILISTTIITTLFFSYKIKKLNMADSLKELER